MKTRALPQLLALLVMACGGRYASSGDSDGAGASGSGGSQGKTTSPPDDDKPSGGITEPSIPPMTGSGGASAAGGGGPIGMAGTSFGVAGAPIGTAGTNAGRPVTPMDACGSFCDSFQMICSAGFECLATCLDGLTDPMNSCSSRHLALQHCIGEALAGAPTGSCPEALAFASEKCGPLASADCGSGGACQEYGGGGNGGCHRITTCASGIADLRCIDPAAGGAHCTCTVNGQLAFEALTDLSSSKAACFSSELFEACGSYLL